MSRTKRQKPRYKHKDPKSEYDPRKDNMYRGGKQYTNKELRAKNVVVPPQQSMTNHVITHIENHDPTRPFALAPCLSCGSNEDNDNCTDHELPIVITVGSKGKNPVACGVFCNINSAFNKTFMIHDEEFRHGKSILQAAIAALEAVATFKNNKPKKRETQTKDINQIIIKTTSSWLVDGFASSSDHYRFRALSSEFDHLVDKLGESTGVRPAVKFWKVRGPTMAQQLAEATLRGWEEVQAQIAAEEEEVVEADD